jgi:hypothetical protein
MHIRADHVAGSFFVAVGLAVIALSTDLPFGHLSMPGAGFLPEIVAVLIILFGGSLFFRAKESPSFAEIEWDDAPHALKVLAISSIAAALYLALGFIVTMVLMMLALLVIIERKNVLRAGFYAACVTVVTYIVFVHVLQSPLPPGVLGYW